MPLIELAHQMWYSWWHHLCRAQGTNCVVAGSAALHQLSTFERRIPSFEPSDFDIFVCINGVTMYNITKHVKQCSLDTGICAGPVTFREKDAMYGNLAPIQIICDFHLHAYPYPIRGARIELPMQIIFMNAQFVPNGYAYEHPLGEPNDPAPQPNGFDDQMFWMWVVSEFDIDIVKTAMPNPDDMNQIHIYSRQALDNMIHGKMEYRVRDHGFSTAAMFQRIDKYQSRGFRLSVMISDDGSAMYDLLTSVVVRDRDGTQDPIPIVVSPNHPVI